jgi:hypothetical protein
MRKALWIIPSLLLFAAIGAPNAHADSITTTPTPATLTLGSCGACVLGDSAALTLDNIVVVLAPLSGTMAGTITFTLYLGATLLDTETVATNGTGTYDTPTGYYLSASSTPGVYQWVASYIDATLSAPIHDGQFQPFTDEQVVVSPATNVPEPGTSNLVLIGLASLGLMAVARKGIPLGHRQAS